jgi:hypothetical protein
MTVLRLHAQDRFMLYNVNNSIYPVRPKQSSGLGKWSFLFGATMKEIQLTQGQVAKVDDGDYEYLNQWNWYYHKGYAVRVDKRILGKQKTIKMHGVIMDTPTDLETDHINHDRLDNRRDNLRVVTHAQNQMNKKKQIDNTSGYKGVSWHKQKNKWIAKIQVVNRQKHLGCFTDMIEAAKAYDAAAIKYFGEFAVLNFPDGEVCK